MANNYLKDLKEEDVEKVVQRYLDWLNSEINIQWAYHNHKETTAWVATAAYITPILLLFKEGLVFTICGKIVVTLGLVALMYAVYVFVNMQFQMRWEAADRSRGLRRAKTKLCAVTTKIQLEELNKNSNFDFDLFDFDPKRETERKITEKANEYPKFITDAISEATTKKQILPEDKKKEEKAELSPEEQEKKKREEEIKKAATLFMWPRALKKINARIRSELASYSALVIVTVTFLFVKVW
jgi:hypothetical protein